MGKKKEESSMYNFRIVAKGWRIRVPLFVHKAHPWALCMTTMRL